MITTIACPLDLTHPEINVDTAPIWVDAEGVQYRVASGVIEAGETDPRIMVVTGVEGLDALAQMGLTQLEDTEPNL